MTIKLSLLFVLGICMWAVLNPRLHTRTIGTLALSMIAILAVVGLCR